jgi:hypothetical protein
MKRLLTVLFFVTSLSNAIAQQNDSLLLGVKNYVEMKGNIKLLKDKDKEKGVIDSALVSILNEKKELVTAFYSNRKGKVDFKLPLQRKFSIEISKKGCVSKIIEINTKMPQNKVKNYEFSFDIGIFEEVKGLNVSVLKKPIAKINYNTFMSVFDYDYNYTGKINTEIEKMYRDYYDLQQSMIEEEEYRKKVKKKRN